MKKSELRNIILEEVVNVLKEIYTYDLIAKKLVNSKLVKKGMSEKELIRQIIIQTRKEYGDKKAKYMVNYDEDYLPNVLGAIKELLGEQKLNERGWVMSPESMISRAVKNGLLSTEEAKSSKVKKAAKENAEDLRDSWPEGEGFGSSDGTAYIKYMLDDAEFKTAFEKGMLVRKDIKDTRKIAGREVVGRYSESVINEVEQNAQTMEQEITKIAKKYFPKSYIDVYFSKNLLPHMTIVFAVGQKKDWSNGIFENDPMSTKMMITYGFNDDGSLNGKPMEFENLSGKLYLKSTNRMYAYDSERFGIRKKKGDYNSIMKAVEAAFAKMKKTVKDNIDRLDDDHQWVKKYV